jgi:hypothetical protein
VIKSASLVVVKYKLDEPEIAEFQAMRLPQNRKWANVPFGIPAGTDLKRLNLRTIADN